MKETLTVHNPTRLDRRIAAFKKLVSGAAMGISVLLFVLAIGGVVFLDLPMDSEEVIRPLIFSIIAVLVIGQIIVRLAPPVMKFMETNAEPEADEPLFP
jgi:hypothetical protein